MGFRRRDAGIGSNDRLRLATLGFLTACLIFAAAPGSARAAAGDIAFGECIGQLTGCTPTNPADAGNDTLELAMTPNGKNLYAASRSGNDVEHFRIGAGGVLTFAGCIGNHTGCIRPSPPARSTPSGASRSRRAAPTCTPPVLAP